MEFTNIADVSNERTSTVVLSEKYKIKLFSMMLTVLFCQTGVTVWGSYVSCPLWLTNETDHLT